MKNVHYRTEYIIPENQHSLRLQNDKSEPRRLISMESVLIHQPSISQSAVRFINQNERRLGTQHAARSQVITYLRDGWWHAAPSFPAADQQNSQKKHETCQ